MLLFHINRDLNIIREFVPKVPEVSITDEEPNFQRICVSESVEGCFSAVIFGGHELKYSMFLNSLYDDGYIDTGIKEYAKFKLYIFDTEDISPENITDFRKLKEDNLVSDCLITKEHWVTNQNICPKEILEIEVHSNEIVFSDYNRRNGANQRLAHNTNIKGKIVTCLERSKNGNYIKTDNHITDKIIRFDDYFRVYVECR